MAVASRTDVAAESRRFVLHDLDRGGYTTTLGALGRRRVRTTYDRGTLEIRTPLPIHERYKSLLGRMIDILTEALDMPVVAAGSTTFQREDLDRGLEPDECYYLASANLVRDWSRIDLAVDPPPDLAIEIDITSSSSRRLGVYAALKVPEVWSFDGHDRTVLRLRATGEYEVVTRSPSFPTLPVEGAAEFLRSYSPADDTAWTRRCRAWVRTGEARILDRGKVLWRSSSSLCSSNGR